MLEMIGRKLLQTLPPEMAHDLAIKALSSPLARLSAHAVPNKPVSLMGLEFPNPVGMAAGFDKNAECIDGLFAQGFGFVEVGTLTPRPQTGNPKPRLFRLSEQQAIINRMGFNNHGVDAAVARIRKSRRRGVLGINIGKNKDTPNERAVDDYVHCLHKVLPLADYVTVNISSPNTPGLRALQEKNQLTGLLQAIKAIQLDFAEDHDKYVPVALKISPDETTEQLQDIAEVVKQSEIDGIICSNTTNSRDMLPPGCPEADEQGGLSGAPLFDKANQTLTSMRSLLGEAFPIVGVGGIMSAADAVRKFKAGADLIQVYTGFIYKGSSLIRAIVDELTHEESH